jgi:hypothetical protein
VKHTQANPFPVTMANGEKVVGELCYCGHFRSEHHDTIAFGHGDCTHCACLKFTWKAMVKGTRKPPKD